MTENHQEIKNLIKQSLSDYYIVARFDTKNRMSELKKDKKQFVAGRSLVYMNSVAANPDKYFSRVQTWDAWDKRLKEECERHPGMDRYHAWMVALPPADIVFNGAEWAIVGGLHQSYYHFCHAVQDWEYAITAEKPEIWRIESAAQKIKKMATEIHVQADLCKSNPVVRMVKGLKYSFCK